MYTYILLDINIYLQKPGYLFWQIFLCAFLIEQKTPLANVENDRKTMITKKNIRTESHRICKKNAHFNCEKSSSVRTKNSTEEIYSKKYDFDLKTTRQPKMLTTD